MLPSSYPSIHDNNITTSPILPINNNHSSSIGHRRNNSGGGNGGNSTTTTTSSSSSYSSSNGKYQQQSGVLGNNQPMNTTTTTTTTTNNGSNNSVDDQHHYSSGLRGSNSGYPTTTGKVKPSISQNSSSNSSKSYIGNNTSTISTGPMIPGEVILEELISDDDGGSNMKPDQYGNPYSSILNSPLTPNKSKSKTPRRWRLIPATQCTCLVHDNITTTSTGDLFCKNCSNNIVSDQKPPLPFTTQPSGNIPSNTHQHHTRSNSNNQGYYNNSPSSSHSTTNTSFERQPYSSSSSSYINYNIPPPSSNTKTSTTTTYQYTSQPTNPTFGNTSTYYSPSKRPDYLVYPSGDYERELRLLKTEVNELEDDFDQLKKSTNDRSRYNSDSINRERIEIQKSKIEVENEIKDTQQQLIAQISNLRHALDARDRENKQLNLNIHDLQNRINEAQTGEKQMGDECTRLQYQLQTFQQEIERKTVDDQLLIELQQQVDTIKHSIESTMRDMDWKDALIDAKKSELNAIANNIKTEKEAATSQAKAEALLEEITILRKKMEELDSASQHVLEEERNRLDSSEQQRIKSEAKVQSQSIEINSLKQVRDEMTQELKTLRQSKSDLSIQVLQLQMDLEKVRSAEQALAASVKDKVMLSKEEMQDIYDHLGTLEILDEESKKKDLLNQQLQSSNDLLESELKDLVTKHINEMENKDKMIEDLNRQIQDLLEENHDMRERLSKVHVVIENSPRVPLSSEQISHLTPSKPRSPNLMYNMNQSSYQSLYKPTQASFNVTPLNSTPTTLKDQRQQQINETWGSLVNNLRKGNSKDQLIQNSDTSSSSLSSSHNSETKHVFKSPPKSTSPPSPLLQQTNRIVNHYDELTTEDLEKPPKPDHLNSSNNANNSIHSTIDSFSMDDEPPLTPLSTFKKSTNGMNGNHSAQLDLTMSPSFITSFKDNLNFKDDNNGKFTTTTTTNTTTKKNGYHQAGLSDFLQPST